MTTFERVGGGFTYGLFLFTDVESSTHLWDAYPEAMPAALARHDEILRSSIEGHDGYVFATGGDGFAAAFARAGDALRAAMAAQSLLAAEGWFGGVAIRVRMGLHTGEAVERDGDYFGPAVNRAARLMSIGHGGQVLVSSATAEIVAGVVFGGAVLLDLGEQRLRDLSRPERVFELTGPGLVGGHPPLRSLDASATNLPVQLTSFIGREEELEAIGSALVGHRLVTVTGAGGVGKSRLALQAAAETVERFDGGCWLVELAPVVEGDRLFEAVAAALGVAPALGATAQESVLDTLRVRHTLILLDNCEHLLGDARRAVTAMLRAGSGAVVLATSREPLGVPGEQVFGLASLDEATAVRLFTERASDADAAFALADQDLPTLRGLCRRLDGMPLAIELAAARVRMFSVAELAARVDQRFRLLTGGRAAVERHRTLRAAIDWSYELLSPAERRLLERLSVFAGGFVLDAVEAVATSNGNEAADAVDLLAGLVDKSLVMADRSGGGTRYRLLETIRQYAEERLVSTGSADRVRQAHATYYGAFARSVGRRLWSAEKMTWVARLEPELDNLRLAVSWAVGHGATDLAMGIAVSMVGQAVGRRGGRHCWPKTRFGSTARTATRCVRWCFPRRRGRRPSEATPIALCNYARTPSTPRIRAPDSTIWPGSTGTRCQLSVWGTRRLPSPGTTTRWGAPGRGGTYTRRWRCRRRWPSRCGWTGRTRPTRLGPRPSGPSLPPAAPATSRSSQPACWPRAGPSCTAASPRPPSRRIGRRSPSPRRSARRGSGSTRWLISPQRRPCSAIPAVGSTRQGSICRRRSLSAPSSSGSPVWSPASPSWPATAITNCALEPTGTCRRGGRPSQSRTSEGCTGFPLPTPTAPSEKNATPSSQPREPPQTGKP
jgi:predicted ATPase/class 3 adenylate cyclase